MLKGQKGFLRALLMAGIVFQGSGAMAQPPQGGDKPGMSREEAQRIMEILQDPEKRRQFMSTLQAIAGQLPPAPQAAPDPNDNKPETLSAQQPTTSAGTLAGANPISPPVNPPEKEVDPPYYATEALMAHPLGGAFTPVIDVRTGGKNSSDRLRVYLYGTLDIGLTFQPAITANGKKSSFEVNLDSGQLIGSRLAEEVRYDFGQDWHAFFVADEGFDVSTGSSTQGGLLYGRQVNGGIANDKYGTLKLGRVFTPLWPLYATTDVFYLGTAGQSAALSPSVARANNAVDYWTPIFDGLQAEFEYSAGEFNSGLSDKQSYGAALRYVKGPWALGVANWNVEGGPANVGALPWYYGIAEQGGTGALYGVPVSETVPFGKTSHIVFVQGSYDFGWARFDAEWNKETGFQMYNWTNTGASGLGTIGTPTGNTSNSDTYLVGSRFPVPFAPLGGTGAMALAYEWQHEHSFYRNMKPHAERVSWGYFDTVSPLLQVFAAYTYIWNDGTGFTAGNATAGGALMMNANSQQFNTGMRFNF